MLVEVATSDSFSNPLRLPPIDALPDSDFAVKRLLEGLPADQDIFYRVSFVDLNQVNAISEPLVGRFRTAPASRIGQARLVRRHRWARLPIRTEIIQQRIIVDGGGLPQV